MAEEIARYGLIIWGDHVSSHLNTIWLHLEKDRVSWLPVMNWLFIIASDGSRILNVFAKENT